MAIHRNELGCFGGKIGLEREGKVIRSIMYDL